MIASALGNAPWSVLAAGVGRGMGVSVGTATILISLLILLTWIPLREFPGSGTVANALLVGVAMDAVLGLISSPTTIVWRYASLAGGIVLVGVGTAVYLGARLGAGPRDGVMLSVHRRTGRSIRLTRTMIEVAVVIAGALLGGRAGIGTLLFALLVGPSVQAAMVTLRVVPDVRQNR